jgi:hypothetical protein
MGIEPLVKKIVASRIKTNKPVMELTNKRSESVEEKLLIYSDTTKFGCYVRVGLQLRLRLKEAQHRRNEEETTSQEDDRPILGKVLHASHHMNRKGIR